MQVKIQTKVFATIEIVDDSFPKILKPIQKAIQNNANNIITLIENQNFKNYQKISLYNMDHE